jgi:RNA polymerase sigma factor (sigma-70 family)
MKGSPVFDPSTRPTLRVEGAGPGTFLFLKLRARRRRGSFARSRFRRYRSGVRPEVSTHASLLAKLRNTGDASAWAEFDDRYRELIFAFARRRGLQPADADDVVQETLAAAHRALPTFEYDPRKGRFRGWLKTAAVRAADLRRRARGDALHHAADDASALAAAEADPEIEAQWDAEWRRYHVRLATAKVRDEFNGKDLAAFEACTVDGAPPAEVAASLGLSVDSVYQAKSRIVKRLREHVAAQVAEEG